MSYQDQIAVLEVPLAGDGGYIRDFAFNVLNETLNQQPNTPCLCIKTATLLTSPLAVSDIERRIQATRKAR